MPRRDSQHRFSPEMQLVLLCARTRLLPDDVSRLHDLARSRIDWEKVQKIAMAHGVSSLVSWHLRQITGDVVPKTVLQDLQERFHATTHRNLALTRELVQLLRLLEEHGIRAIPLKGPLLAARHYGNLGFRSFIDLDLLVRREDLDRCGALLTSIGYVAPDSQRGELTEAHREAQLGFDFYHPDRRIPVELHWALIQKWLSFRVDPDPLWERARAVKLGGAQVTSLSPEDTLLYLCAHGAKHQWEKLIWLCDIAEVIRTEPALEWEEVFSRARSAGAVRILLWALRLAHELLDAPVPNTLLKAAQRSLPVQALSRDTVDKLCHATIAAETRCSPAARSDLVYLLGKERWTDKWSYVYHLIKLSVRPTARDRAFICLPVKLAFLYPLIRPVRVAASFMNGAPRN